jgi:hypothetical protein
MDFGLFWMLRIITVSDCTSEEEPGNGIQVYKYFGVA